MYKYILATFLSFSIFFTPLSAIALDINSSVNNELAELATLLPESELIVAINAEQVVRKTIPALLNNDLAKLEKLTTLVKTIEENTGINVMDVNQVAIGYNIFATKKKTKTPNIDFTLLLKTNVDNTDLVETWAKKYDLIFSFEKERAESKSYIESFKKFNTADYSKSLIESRKEYLPKIQATLKKAREIENRLKTVPNSETKDEIVEENNKIIEKLEELNEIFQSDISLGDLSTKATDLINRWNKVSIGDSDRSARLNAILKESKEIYSIFAKKYDHTERSEKVISIINVFDTAEVSFEQRSFFDKTNGNLSKISSSFRTLPAAAAARQRALVNINKDMKSTKEEIESVFDTGMYALIDQTPFDKPEEDDFQKTKIQSFYQEFQKNAKVETINSKKLISVNLKSFFEKEVEEAPADGEDKPEPIEYETLGIGFLDNKTLAIGTSEAVSEILNRDSSVKNTRALELLSFTKNPLVSFALDSQTITKNSPKKEEVKTSSDEKKDDSEETPDESDHSSPTDEFFDFLKSSDIYGSLDFDPNSKDFNELALSVGLLWNQVEEPEVPLVGDGKGDDAEITGTSLEVAGLQIAKELGYDLLKTFKGLEAKLLFKFEKDKIADLILKSPEIINGEFQAKKTAQKVRRKPLQIKDLPNFLTSPEFYSDLVQTFKKK